MIAVLLLGLVGAGRAAVPEPSPVKPALALRVAHLRFLLATRDTLTALAFRRRLPDHALAGRSHLDTRLRLAERLLDYGLLAAAAELYRGELRRGADRRRNRGWFRLAQAWLARGAYDEALAAVQQLYGLKSPELQYRVAPLAGRILLANQLPEQAVERLRAWQRQRNRNAFGRYNLGVALVRAGLNEQGAGELDAIGRMDADTDTLQALRDRANMVLAYGFLEIGQGATARALFERVRLNGPYSNRALLGLGWAELAPDGEPQSLVLLRPIHCIEDSARLLPENLPVLRRPPRDACGRPRMFRSEDELERDSGADTQSERYRRALVPWLELADRDPAYTAVQEALVGIAYAYAQLDAEERATIWFARAISTLEASRSAAKAVVAGLRQPSPGPVAPPPGVTPDLGWFIQHWGLAGAGARPALAALIGDTGFRACAQALQDLGFVRDGIAEMRAALDRLQRPVQHRIFLLALNDTNLPTALMTRQERLRTLMDKATQLSQRVKQTMAAQAAYLRQRALVAAAAYKDYVDAYLIQARKGQAQLVSVTSAAMPAGETR